MKPPSRPGIYLANRIADESDLYAIRLKPKESLELREILSTHGLWPESWLSDKMPLRFAEDTRLRMLESIFAIASDLQNILFVLQLVEVLRNDLNKHMEREGSEIRFEDVSEWKGVRLEDNDPIPRLHRDTLLERVWFYPAELTRNAYLNRIQSCPSQAMRDIVTLGYIPVIEIAKYTIRPHYTWPGQEFTNARIGILFPNEGL